LQRQYLTYLKYGAAKNLIRYVKLTVNAHDALTYATFFILFMEVRMETYRWLEINGKTPSFF